MTTRARIASLLFAVVALAACSETPATTPIDGGPIDGGRDAGTDAGPEPPLVPDLVCPGAPSCPAGNDGTLLVGAARVSITPNLADYETYTDTNGNGEYDPATDAIDDRNGNGTLDAIWIAGFGNARAATGVADDVHATAIALRNGDITIVFVSLDVVGWFVDEVERVRELLVGVDVDYLVMAATHQHEGPDTIGIWGVSLGDSGLVPAYQRFVREQSAEAVRRAVAALEPASLEHATFRLRDAAPDGDITRWVGDNRDPNIVDDEVRVLRFVRAGTAMAGDPGSGETIATFVNFASHPEYQGSRPTRISSDWPHFMRVAMETGIEVDDAYAEPAEPIGGVTLLVQGALGVQIGPNRVRLRDRMDVEVPEPSREAAAVVGTQLGAMILAALRGTLPAATPTVHASADLGLRRATFFAQIQNRRYHIAGRQGLFDRMLYNFDEGRPIVMGNYPDVRTEIAVIDVGPATMLTLPGELDPAEFVGGYEAPCDYTPGGCENLVNEMRENPPDVSMAPRGPFLADRLRARRPDAESVWALGCTQDFLGYFIPEFDFELDPGVPYIGEAPGAHYEETNSIGETGWPRIRGKMIELIEWSE